MGNRQLNSVQGVVTVRRLLTCESGGSSDACVACSSSKSSPPSEAGEACTTEEVKPHASHPSAMKVHNCNTASSVTLEDHCNNGSLLLRDQPLYLGAHLCCRLLQ